MAIPADRILHNARIYTLDPQRPIAQALAIHRGRVVAVGAKDDILPLAGPGTRIENAAGCAILPGLTDAHIHWEMTALALNRLDVFEAPSKESVLEKVAALAERTPPGEWIVGWGWLQDLWPGQAFPTAADLDSVAPNHRVYLAAKSVHAAWVNSGALAESGIGEHTPNPDGGVIARDSGGQPTGILFETAMKLVSERIPKPPPERLADLMHIAQEQALRLGLTGLHDFDDPSALHALQVLREREQLGLRVVKQINKRWFQAALDSGLRWNYGDDWIRIGGLKLFADGALGPHTALMVEPYADDRSNYGVAVTPKEEMTELVSQASAAGLPSTIHAIGDRAVRDVLDVFERARAEELARSEARASRRHRIEHVQIIHPDDRARLKELDLIASMQPLHATTDMPVADAVWGERCAWAYNPRLQLDQGVVVAFGSDSPVEPFDPWKGIHAAVTRQRIDGSPRPDGWYPDARLSLHEALIGYTQGPAYAAGMEDRLGILAPGYLADLIVLDRDPFTVPTAELWSIQVQATMVDGVWRWGGL